MVEELPRPAMLLEKNVFLHIGCPSVISDIYYLVGPKYERSYLIRVVLTVAGTTSKPKGVPLTHANLAASLHNIAATYELTHQDRSLLVMPLFHVHGLMAGMKPSTIPFNVCLCE